jgi:Methyltransferase domain
VSGAKSKKPINLPSSADDRPSALAHINFNRIATKLEMLPLAERFTRIVEDGIWGAGTSASGLGSELTSTRAIQSELPLLAARLGIRSVLDAPCGDAGWISTIDWPVTYHGVDIVKSQIARNHRRYRHSRKMHFSVADITQDVLPKADAILCRDCLVHLSFPNIERAMAKFKGSGATWLLTTSFSQLSINQDCVDGDWRPLNFQVAPFHWPRPIHEIEEKCLENNGAWRDKTIAVWLLANIP